MAAEAAGYHEHLRAEVLDLLPPRPRRVLEVGCAAGVSGAAVRRRHPACEVIGVEVDAGAAARAAGRLDRVLVGDVERLDLEAAGVEAGSLDALLYADVLEHLRDPWALVRRHAALLADGGWVVASLPNVRYCEVLLGLLRGTWEYADAGVLDRGHLRFFTRREGERLLADAGLRVIGTRPIYWQPATGGGLGGGDTAWVQLEEFRISGLAPDAVDELRAGQIVYAAVKGEPVLPWAFPGAHGFRFLAPPGEAARARALAAWAEAFDPGDDVALVVTAAADALPAAGAAVRAALARAGRAPETTADVIVEPVPPDAAARRRQLRAVDALVAAAGPDGATLAAEAARAGRVPVVAADPAALRAAAARVARGARPRGADAAPRAEGRAG
jgi:SAM-dependent methyltransferase